MSEIPQMAALKDHKLGAFIGAPFMISSRGSPGMFELRLTGQRVIF